jgi:hypothetical protein
VADLWPSGVAAFLVVAAALAWGLWRGHAARRSARRLDAMLSAALSGGPSWALRVVASPFVPRGSVLHAQVQLLVNPHDLRRFHRLAERAGRR